MYLIIFVVWLGFKNKNNDPISFIEVRDIVKWMDTECPLKQYLHSFRIFPRTFLFIFIFVQEKKYCKTFEYYHYINIFILTILVFQGKYSTLYIM